MLKKFSGIQNGTKFTHNGIEYIKVPEHRISCCSFTNAAQTDDPNKKIGIPPATEVEVAE